MTTPRKSKSLAAVAALSLLLGLGLASPLCAQEDAADPTPTEDTAQPPLPDAKEKNPRRAETFSEALSSAGEDGIAVFCYGPDWNQRSVRMLNKFWQSQELEMATGSAILVAAPYYQVPTPEQEQESNNITSGMPAPPFGVCPTVMLFNKDGVRYANLPGMDYLGDETGALALKNIRDKIEALRAQQKLLQQAENMSGLEKAKILSQVADLPIDAPRNLIDMLKEADPSDQSGLVRRNTYSAKQFLYDQMETTDGFISTDFVPDYNKIKAECMKIVKDETLRPEDRQAAYALLIGQSRRDHVSGKQNIPGKQMKDYISGLAKIDPNTPYGKLSSTLSGLWGNLRVSSETRQAYRDSKKAADRDRREKDREDKKAAKNVNVE